jgi:hypothetical protein
MPGKAPIHAIRHQQDWAKVQVAVSSCGFQQDFSRNLTLDLTILWKILFWLTNG